MLVVTRPDVIGRAARRATSRSASTSSRPTPSAACRPPLGEYGLADRAHEINLAGARIAREVADSFATPTGPGSWPARSGPGTKFPSLGQIRFADLRDQLRGPGPRPARRRRRPVHHRDPSSTCSRLKAAMIGARRAMAAAGRAGPAAGAGHHRADRPHAARHRDRRRPVPPSTPCGPTSSASTAPPARPRWASTSATCPSTPACRSRASPTPACRRWSTARCTTTSPPRSWPSTTPASSPSSASASSAAAAAPRPGTSPAVVDALPRTSSRPPRQPVHEAGRHLDLLDGAVRPGHRRS